MDQEFDDNALIRAARKRIVRELEAQQASAGGGGVVNNVYGGAGGAGGHSYGGSSPGLMERMNGAESDNPDLYDYLVDIERRDLPEVNPETGKPVGWTKKVHRHREEKKK